MSEDLAGDGTDNRTRPDQIRADDPEAMRKSWFDITPLGRLGTPRDVAQAMLFLSSDESRFVTGLPLVIDGGRMIP